MVATVNARVLLNIIPSGLPEPGKTTITDRTKTIDLDGVELTGGILIKFIAASVDPYMRLIMREPGNAVDFKGVKSWIVGETTHGPGIAEVLRSETGKFTVGQHLFGILAHSEYAIVTDHSHLTVLPEGTGLPWSTYLSVAGWTGLTAFASWKEYAQAKSGQIAFISAGAGAVGSIVIQLAKRDGLKVIASAGSDKKVEFMRSIGADVAFNYKTTSTQEILHKEGPIDVYYDNVGGETLDAALANANEYGRFIISGSISGYNGQRTPIKNFDQVVAKNLFIQGFTAVDLVQKYASEFYATVPAQAVKGELKWQEHIYQGIDGVHQALTDVLTGGNEGKAIVMFATE